MNMNFLAFKLVTLATRSSVIKYLVVNRKTARRFDPTATDFANFFHQEIGHAKKSYLKY